MEWKNYKNMQISTFEKYIPEEKIHFVSSSSQVNELNHCDKKQKPTLLNSCPILASKSDGISTMGLCSSIPALPVLKWPGQELAKGLSCNSLNQSVNKQPLKFESQPKRPKPKEMKQYRRSWTPELHAKFLEALEYFGSPEAAKPKLIRDFMNFEGLTIDQVKSHLQKHRLQIKRTQATEQIL